jgi:glutathione S-transferase
VKLYVTYTSPYARLARILVIEKGLQSRVEIIEAHTRKQHSPYYQVNPSGRVPYLITDEGVGLEDSQLICAFLDCLDGEPRLHQTSAARDLDDRRLEASARSLCDGVSVWVREMSRPERERSPTVLAHEVSRCQRMADFFERWVSAPLFDAEPSMAHLVLAVALETARKRGPCDLTVERPRLASWLQPISDRPSMRATALP